MRSVWKFTVPLTNGKPVAHSVPVGGIVRHVAMDAQSGMPAVWIEIDPKPDAECETRSFVMTGTGHLVDDDSLQYLGTTQDGFYVWHCWEKVDG